MTHTTTCHPCLTHLQGHSFLNLIFSSFAALPFWFVVDWYTTGQKLLESGMVAGACASATASQLGQTGRTCALETVSTWIMVAPTLLRMAQFIAVQAIAVIMAHSYHLSPTEEDGGSEHASQAGGSFTQGGSASGPAGHQRTHSARSRRSALSLSQPGKQ